MPVNKKKAVSVLEKAKLHAVKKTAATKESATDKAIRIAKAKRKSQGLSTKKDDIKKDAKRAALPAGKRISAEGNVYYENRDNRIDRKPKKHPKLEDGGKLEGENGYIAYYKGKEKEVYAKTSYAAREKAAKLFNAKKSYEVTVVLAEKDGEQVTHTPTFAKGGAVSAKKAATDKAFRIAKAKRKSQGLSTKKDDIKKDADRPALPAGRRVSAEGNIYWENRENRTDRKPRRHPMLQEGGSLDDKYKTVDGTSYRKSTPDEVIQVLENARKNKTKIKIYLGDTQTGRDWLESNDTIGTVSRSTGTYKVPILITSSRSMGGGSISDDCILKIKNFDTGTILYQHPKYIAPTVEIVPSDMEEYTNNVIVNGEIYSRHRSQKSAQILAKKIMEQGGSITDCTDEVLKHYIMAALWSSNDDNGDPLDSTYSSEDIAPESMERMRVDVSRFLTENEALLEESEMEDEQIGHDFWLTRNHHGAGFFDRDIDTATIEKLTASAHKFGEASIVVGDDGKLYQEGGASFGEDGLVIVEPEIQQEPETIVITEQVTSRTIEASRQFNTTGEMHRLFEDGSEGSYKKGGLLKNRAEYISHNEIESITTWDGKVIDGADILDGFYVKKTKK